MSHDFEKQILVAGVGNAWLQDDGFGLARSPSGWSGASCPPA